MSWRESNAVEEVTSETSCQLGDAEGPYIVHAVTRVSLARSFNPGYNQDAECKCGHPYYRHFDTYEEMYPCGCKYCDCYVFKLPQLP